VGMSTVEVEGIEVTETSRAYTLPPTALPPPTSPSSGERIWKWAALVLTVLVAAGALTGGFGNAFYVSRPEYTIQTQTDAVARENMRGTLERLDKTLTLQADAFKALAVEVQSVKVDLAVLQKNR
jgi:hypothetical protein